MPWRAGVPLLQAWGRQGQADAKREAIGADHGQTLGVPSWLRIPEMVEPQFPLGLY